MSGNKKNVYLFQPQYSVYSGSDDEPPIYWIPYSVGCIWSYVSQFDEITNHFELKDLIFRRESIPELIDRLDNPAVCGFSSYVWNEMYCNRVAELVKKKWPNCIIVFGGPNIESPTLNIDYIDAIIEAEGELSFHKLLKQIINKEEISKSFKPERIQDLIFPSPYTTGIFDKIIEDNPNAFWNMTFETNRGCPFKCTFCNWGMVTMSKIKRFGLERVQADLEWAVEHRVDYLICADANFGIFKDRDLEIAKLIRSAADRSYIDSVNLQYTKNSTETIFEIAKIIGPYSKGITLSVQSMHDQTLDAIKRKNLDVNDMEHMLKLSRKYDVLTYTEFIMGLPLETLESWKEGLCKTLRLGQHSNIDVWFGQLLDGSEMASFDSIQQYGIKFIKAHDYFLENSKEDEKLKEVIKIVNATNTQTTEEMIEGFMYSWMIITFHIGGYSQIYSRYAYSQMNIDYRKFYDLLFKKLQTGFYKDHFNKVKSFVTTYLTKGEIQLGVTNGHNIQYVSNLYAHKNIDESLNITQKVFVELCGHNNKIIKLQNLFLYNDNETYPQELELDFELTNFKTEKTKYQVDKRKIDLNWSKFKERRRGPIRNIFTKLS